jgi:hypothetical protein
MSVPTIAAFPDTNLFLHYRPLEEIDWCALLKADAVVINIAPVVTRELEEQKTLHQSRKIRDRAATALKLLYNYLGQEPPRRVRDGVTLDFVVNEPSAEFAATRGLNLQLADDRLIGTLFLHSEEDPNRQCVLVTNDFPLAVKANHYQISLLKPPDALLLPTEPDIAEKKIKQLEAELLRYKSRVPVLDVFFNNREKHEKIQITVPSGDSESEIRSMLEAAKQKHPLIEMKPPAAPGNPDERIAAIAESLRAVTEQMYGLGQQSRTDYNTRLRGYYRDYEKYLRDVSAFKALLLRTIKLELVLGNGGTCPAEDIHVLLHFPNGFGLFDEEHFPAPPKEPPIPSNKVNVFPNMSLLSYPDIHRLPQPRDPTLPKITNSYDVTFKNKKLQHNFEWPLTPLYVAFDSWESAESFSIDYTVHAGNMIDEARGELGVIVQKV